MEERLQKTLARAGIASRRAAEELIRTGRVTVNGRKAELGVRVDPEHDVIAVDGRPVARQAAPVYLMLHKPAGYVCTRADPQGRPTVYELVPDIPGLFTVGRLDQDTEGLLLLTTDGDWAERLAHPRYNIEREYEVYVRGPLQEQSLERLRDGILLDGRLARPVSATAVHVPGFTSVLSIVMVEGRWREVRLLCAGAGLPVKRLVRRRFGPLLLGWLALGDWRALQPAEVTAFFVQRRHPGSGGKTATGARAVPAAGGRRQEATKRVPKGTDRDRRPGGVR